MVTISIGGVQRATAAPLKVACVGEHTTHSNLYQNNDREHQPAGMQEYPMKLQVLMGAGYDVRNFGDCCASVVQGYSASETHPFVSGGNFKNSVSFAPDIVVIGSWGRHDWGLSAQTAYDVFSYAKFQSDYEDLIKRYLALPKKPKIYASLPIPILYGEDGPDRGYKTSPAADAIKAVAAKYDLQIVDLFSAFLHRKDLFIPMGQKDGEGEHANDMGLQKIAEVVAAALKGGTPDGGVTDAATDSEVATDAWQSGGRNGGGGMNGSTGGAGGSNAGSGGASGGATGSGGMPGSGGTASTGGAPASGGVVGSGGAMTATGGFTGGGGQGQSGTGGAGNATDASVSPPGSGPSAGTGCACSTGTLTGQPWLGTLLVVGLFVAARQRRARASTGRARCSTAAWSRPSR